MCVYVCPRVRVCECVCVRVCVTQLSLPIHQPCSHFCIIQRVLSILFNFFLHSAHMFPQHSILKLMQLLVMKGLENVCILFLILVFNPVCENYSDYDMTFLQKFAYYGPPHIAVQKQDDQHEHTFSNYVRIRDVVQKTCLTR